jgi:hypothetical protein
VKEIPLKLEKVIWWWRYYPLRKYFYYYLYSSYYLYLFRQKKDFEKVEEKGGKDWRCASTSNGGSSSHVFNATRTMESNGRPGIYRPCGRRTSRSLRSWVGGGGREQERAFKKTTTPPLEHFWLYTIKKEEEEETEEKGTVDIFLSTLSI